MGYRWLWSADARQRAAQVRGVQPDEADEALMAPVGMRTEHVTEDGLLVVCGMAWSGRVIAVLLAPVEADQLYEVIDLKALSGEDLDAWRGRVL